MSKEEQMLQCIEQWQQSGLTKKDYCNINQVSYHKFKYWCKQMGYIKKRNLRSDKAKSDFISIQPVSMSASGKGLSVEITYPNGVRLNLSANTPMNILTDLIRLY